MKTSVEVSMYPLTKQYKTPILDFINRLNQHAGLTVKTNSMSTQIFGNYDEVMSAVTKEIKVSFEKDPTVIMVMKVLNIDVSQP